MVAADGKTLETSKTCLLSADKVIKDNLKLNPIQAKPFSATSFLALHFSGKCILLYYTVPIEL